MNTLSTEKSIPAAVRKSGDAAVLAVLFAISFSHLLNDTIQSLLPAVYPILKASFGLDFSQIGLITLTFQMTASILQPFVGIYTDHKPQPFSLAAGMGVTLVGVILLSRATSFHALIFSAGMVGLGSSVFHPESSRVARMASGGKHGFAQSVFQVGGNAGSSLGPLLAALIVVPHGQSSIIWFSVLALAGIVLLSWVGRWYKAVLANAHARPAAAHRDAPHSRLSQRQVVLAMTVLIALIFSKYFYLASMTNYYTFYLIDRFHLTVQATQFYLFLFLFAVAGGTMIGGPIGDRFGRKNVIWVSILGVAPFSLALPFANLFWTGVLSVIIGLILASAFSAILVYAQDLVPGKVGMISGLFFGFAFGMAGIASAVLGELADHTSINFVFHVCAYLPLIGLLTGFLPKMHDSSAAAQPARG